MVAYHLCKKCGRIKVRRDRCYRCDPDPDTVRWNLANGPPPDEETKDLAVRFARLESK